VNLLYVPDVKTSRRLRSRSVLATREPLRNGDFREKNLFRPQENSEFGGARSHGMATIGRLLKIIGLFFKRVL